LERSRKDSAVLIPAGNFSRRLFGCISKMRRREVGSFALYLPSLDRSDRVRSTRMNWPGRSGSANFRFCTDASRRSGNVFAEHYTDNTFLDPAEFGSFPFEDSANDIRIGKCRITLQRVCTCCFTSFPIAIFFQLRRRAKGFLWQSAPELWSLRSSG